jgi:serine/threonine-protein kinase
MKNFEILQKLGNQYTRKFASVFLVKRKLDDKRFVLKCVEKNEKTIIQQEKITQEAQFQLEKPFFQKTIDFWEDTNCIYLLKEYIEGETVDQWWNKQKDKKIDRINFVLNGLAPAFNFLKENSLVHNDIKPSNILVTNRNGKTEFILIDFGLAFYFPKADNQEVLFALGYSSPELILSKKSIVNHSSDLFSLGIVLYQLWTRKLPLSHPNPTVYTNLQITHPLINAGNVPDKLFQLISKMCVKHQFRLPPNQLPENEVMNALIEAKNQRYQTVNEIIDDIDKIELIPWWKFLIKIFSKSNRRNK